MQEELKTVLTLFRDKRRILDIVKTPEIYIQQSASAAEVEKWLLAKGFSEKVVKKLNGFNGNELFSLKRHTMEDYFGTDEGRRLASQITIQRNISGVICRMIIMYNQCSLTFVFLLFSIMFAVQNGSLHRTAGDPGQGANEDR